MLRMLFIAIFPVLIGSIVAKKWAFLATGAEHDDFLTGYALEANMAHQYHLLLKHGISAENIVTMSLNEIAHDKRNKFPGKLFNRNGGPDVHKGVQFDYQKTKNDVSPHNFLAVLRGDKEAVGGRRVIESTEEDEVFVFLADHGGSNGVVYFPGGVLTGHALVSTLKEMHAKKRYKRMAFYLTACFSGAMFNKRLPNDINIYATTSSSPYEVSWTCERNETLGAELTTAFDQPRLRIGENASLAYTTQDELFKIANAKARRIFKEYPQRYGDLSLGAQALSIYMGEKEDPGSEMPKEWCIKKDQPRRLTPPESHIDNVYTTQHIELDRKKLEHETETDPVKKAKLHQQIKQEEEWRVIMRMFFYNIIWEATGGSPLKSAGIFSAKYDHIVDPQCHHDAVMELQDTCWSALNKRPFAKTFMWVLNNVCAEPKKEVGIVRIKQAIKDTCDKFKFIMG